jgi:N-acetylmuramoyl-L-alanine amidase
MEIGVGLSSSETAPQLCEVCAFVLHTRLEPPRFPRQIAGLMMHCFAVALLAAVLWASGVVGASAAPTAPATTTRARDTDYVRIAEWARWQGLKWRWLKRDESFQLTNTAARIQFAAGSREAYYNGLQLWLLYPLVTRGNEIYISQLDVDFTFRPLLAAPRNDSGKKVRTICLDAGHGGRDPGNQASGRQEKDLTMRLTAELRDQLQKAGFKVVFSRTSDRYIEHTERANIARKRGADLFISLHFNGTGGNRSAAQGSEVYAMTPAGAASTNARGEGAGSRAYPGNRNNPKNLLLAYQIQKALVRVLDSEDRGVRRARFEVLREATMPAVLVEAGFLSHPVEGKKIFTAEYRKQMARAIVEGIQSYKKVVER